MVDRYARPVLVLGRVHAGKWSEWRALGRAEMGAETGGGEPHPDLFPDLPPVPPAPAPELPAARAAA